MLRQISKTSGFSLSQEFECGMAGGVWDSGKVRELGESEIEKNRKKQRYHCNYYLSWLIFWHYRVMADRERFNAKKASRSKTENWINTEQSVSVYNYDPCFIWPFFSMYWSLRHNCMALINNYAFLHRFKDTATVHAMADGSNNAYKIWTLIDDENCMWIVVYFHISA